MIGNECNRAIWYGFRWVLQIPFSGRMLRLFNRGHREEDRFIEWLIGIGCKVYSHTPDGKQFRITGVNGHFGGSLDAIIEFPPHWGIAEPVLGEFKTQGTGPKFNQLVAKGMAVMKPLHYAQTSTYGSDPNYAFRYVLYMAINKNDDSIHVELAKLDWNLGDQMRIKAERIITSQKPPPRLSDNPTFQTCKYCDFYGICHMNQAAEINCRSCEMAQPIENGEWACMLPAHMGRGPLPEHVIKTGCSSYRDITLEPGTSTEYQNV